MSLAARGRPRRPGTAPPTRLPLLLLPLPLLPLLPLLRRLRRLLLLRCLSCRCGQVGRRRRGGSARLGTAAPPLRSG